MTKQSKQKPIIYLEIGWEESLTLYYKGCNQRAELTTKIKEIRKMVANGTAVYK